MKRKHRRDLKRRRFFKAHPKYAHALPEPGEQWCFKDLPIDPFPGRIVLLSELNIIDEIDPLKAEISVSYPVKVWETTREGYECIKSVKDHNPIKPCGCLGSAFVNTRDSPEDSVECKECGECIDKSAIRDL